MGYERDSSRGTGNDEKCERDLDSWREVGAFRLWEMQSRGRQDLDPQAGKTGRRLISSEEVTVGARKEIKLAG